MAKLLTVDEIADELSVSRNRVYDLAAAGLIPVVRLGRLLRFDPDQIAEWKRDGGSRWPPARSTR
ncbi:MAG: helix-turn-helix domain-containing protein [Candidatus Sericytochromatia bacterium]|nr:helix-turn-helix domain-containing protein [Candidatus Tanganyikabacteria bacterium]